MTVQLPPGSWHHVGLLLQVYNVGFVNSLTHAAPWIAYESRFNLWDHDGRIHVRRYAGERCIPECVIERHSGLTPGVMLEVVPFLEGIPRIFQQDIARPHVAKTVRDFFSVQHIQLLPWPAYSPDMSPIELVWDLVGRRFARDPLPAASKDENFCCAYKQYGVLFHKQTFKICLTPCYGV
ncbi:transposable element Tc1 transposase [Trichonephila clavipes]|nr:transposable element Tc1 transposase [Trichonephila clavipes]